MALPCFEFVPSSFDILLYPSAYALGVSLGSKRILCDLNVSSVYRWVSGSFLFEGVICVVISNNSVTGEACKAV